MNGQREVSRQGMVRPAPTCGSCAAYTQTAGRDAMAGLGNCTHAKDWEYVSESRPQCKFDPSRYEPIAPRETLELT